MKLTGAGWAVRALEDAGVSFVFGIPGTHNIEFWDSVRDSKCTPILVTDEQSASFMADGVARSTGRLAALALVPGAGLTHALSGIAECWLDQVPLLVLASGLRRDTGKHYQLHAVDQMSIVKPVAKEVISVQSIGDVYAVVRRAAEQALAAPQGPVVVEIPAEYNFFRDIRSSEFVPGAAPASSDATSHIVFKDDSTYRQIVEAVRRCERPVLYVGRGAEKAALLLPELAQRMGAAVFTTISGKGVFPEDHNAFAWNVVGRGAPKPLAKLCTDADLMLAIGCRFGEVATASYGMEQPRQLIHVDIDPTVFHKNYQADLSLTADATDFVTALLRDLPEAGRSQSAWTASNQAIKAGLAPQLSPPPGSGGANRAEASVAPPLFFAALQSMFGDDAVYATDSGNGTFLAMEHLRLRRPGCFLAPVDYSCMGYAVPAAIGAALACPGRAVISLPGDGAFLMTGLEILTARAYKVPVGIFVLRDGELAQIAAFQRRSLAQTTCTEIHSYDLEKIADAAGIRFLRIAENADIVKGVTEARNLMAAGNPVVVEVAIDYSEPTFFTRGVMATNIRRLPFKDKARLIARYAARTLSLAGDRVFNGQPHRHKASDQK